MDNFIETTDNLDNNHKIDISTIKELKEIDKYLIEIHLEDANGIKSIVKSQHSIKEIEALIKRVNRRSVTKNQK